MDKFGRQLRGYNRKKVDDYILELENKIKQLEESHQTSQEKIQSLQDEMFTVNSQNELLVKQLMVQEKTNEEIARLALKEASELLEKAKRNANMILKESMEYVRGLSKDMDTFKKEAIDFRENVVKMSEDILETIDKSEIFGLIKEEENAKKENVYKETL